MCVFIRYRAKARLRSRIKPPASFPVQYTDLYKYEPASEMELTRAPVKLKIQRPQAIYRLSILLVGTCTKQQQQQYLGETASAVAFGPLMLRRKSARLDDGAAEVLLLVLGWLAGVQVACCAVARLAQTCGQYT